MDTREKSVLTLELPEVLEIIASKAVSDGAKEKILATRPLEDIDDVRETLMECTDALRLMSQRSAPGFSGLSDITASVTRTKLGGVLNMRELLRIGSLLRATRNIKDYGDIEYRKSEFTTVLDIRFNMLTPNRFLEDRISTSILSEEEMADTASAELGTIRRKIKNVNARVREVLNRIISSQTYQRVLQENIITQRSGRFVVPIKAEFRSEFQGLVHDVSSSGATLFIEPVQVVEANNELRVLEGEEQKEIERILAEMSDDVASTADKLMTNFETMTYLDAVFARAKYSLEADCAEPEITEEKCVSLKRARHPLLDRRTAVAIDIGIGDGYDTLVITGPNTGGKTVALKTLGLLTLMALCGLHIPASETSKVCMLDGIYADIGDEQSITQSLSTFSSHMRNIVGILDELTTDSLVLFDELGAGTDPTEGAALAMAIIEHTRARGALVAATTHYAELKVYALSREGVENAACEFNVETLRPTYRLLTGVPGKSNAFAISGRLGLHESIIDAARESLGETDREFEEVIGGLERERQRLESEREEAIRLRREAEETKRKSIEKTEQVAASKERELENARREAKRIIDDARAAAQLAYDEVEQLRKGAMRDAYAVNVIEAKAAVGRILNEAETLGKLNERKKSDYKGPPRPLKSGDIVELISTGTRATVLEASEKSDTVQLQAGIMKISARKRDIKLLDEETAKDSVKVTMTQPSVRVEQSSKTMTATTSLYLRGKNSDEALMELERFLDSSVLANMETVTIIHGKGTGVLRSAVHDYLRRERRVKSFRLGRYGEGETGVTVVEF
ncbi:MAG: endonuclease MutS2 [Clostridiales bacterium]|nr:endonuclease MutS2 [Clostridiales bacterium]